MWVYGFLPQSKNLHTSLIQSVNCPVCVCTVYVCVCVRADDSLVTCPVNAGIDSSTMTNDLIKEGPLLGECGKCSHAQLPRRFYCVVSLQ